MKTMPPENKAVQRAEAIKDGDKPDNEVFVQDSREDCADHNDLRHPHRQPDKSGKRGNSKAVR